MTEKKTKKQCNWCSNCVLQDVGYSNYTVEGTEVYCSLNLHPNQGFDQWYGDDPRLQFADTCPSFQEGDPVCCDVDGEEVHTPEQQAKIDACNPRNITYNN